MHASLSSPVGFPADTSSGAAVFSSLEPAEKSALRPYAVRVDHAFQELRFGMEHPRPGLSIFVCDFSLPEPHAAPFAMGEGVVTFSTVLSGRARWHVSRGGGQRQVTVDTPCDMVCRGDDCAGEIFLDRGAPHQVVNLHVQTELLQEYLDVTAVDKNLREGLDRRGGMHVLSRLSADTRTRNAARQILHCSLSGPCRRLFLESRALDMLSVFLGRLEKPRTAVSLSSSDVERLHEARRILRETVDEQPSIRELARQTGLNEMKLKRGFRALFGCTVFQVARAERLERARTLLQDTDTTVGAVAAMTGYTNMSHFIAAFRTRFGQTPGEILTRSRRHPL